MVSRLYGHFTIPLLLLILCAIYQTDAMTRQQLKKTLTIMKKQCFSKHNVTEDQVGGIEQGKFVEVPQVMCYVACVYRTIRVVKDNRLNQELVYRQVDLLYPNDMKVPVKNAVATCIQIQDQFIDHCEAIFYAAKCLYAEDPANFVFP